MTLLKSTGKISTAIRELQDAFDRSRPIREGGAIESYESPRGTLRRDGSVRRSSSQSTESIPRWR